MEKTRIYELAKKLGKETKEVLRQLQGLGIDAKNHMSVLEDGELALAMRKLGGEPNLRDIKDNDGNNERQNPDANASASRSDRPARNDSARSMSANQGANAQRRPDTERSAAGATGNKAAQHNPAHRSEIRAIKAESAGAPASKGWTRFDNAGKPVAGQRPAPKPEGRKPQPKSDEQKPAEQEAVVKPTADQKGIADNETKIPVSIQTPPEVKPEEKPAADATPVVESVSTVSAKNEDKIKKSEEIPNDIVIPDSVNRSDVEVSAKSVADHEDKAQPLSDGTNEADKKSPVEKPKPQQMSAPQRQDNRPMRPQGEGQGSYQDRGPRQGGYQDRGPRPQGGYQQGGYQDRGPRPQNNGQQGGFQDRGPRPQGGYQDRGPRPQGEGQGGYQDRGPRQGGYQDRGPRPQGGYQQGGYQDRGPRPQGEGQGGYQDRGPRQGGYQDRGPRPQGGYQQGGGYQDRGPRPQGGFQDRGPRPQGGFQQGAQGGRKPGFGQSKLVIPQPPASVTQEKPTSTRAPFKKDVRKDSESEKTARNRKSRVNIFDIDDERETRLRTKAKAKGKRHGFSEAEFRERKKDKLEIPESLTIRDLAKRMGVEANHVMRKLITMGVMATINDIIDGDTASLVAQEYGLEVVLIREKEEAILNIAEQQSLPENLYSRPPIVTIMGHVDHGKTSLLDAIRQTNVTAGEAGGITQHIGAYQVELNGRKITFLDTPGHAAFTAMRARGAQVTDIAVLVVAAEDGVMPQTIEAINHAKAAEVPIIVAINKIDKPEANPDRVKQELTEYGLVVEEWGGETIAVNVSATQKIGLEELLEMILLVADVKDMKADPTVRARGSVVEAELDKGMGPVATVLVLNGTLHTGDSIIAGVASGKVRAMFDDKGEKIEEAGPSTPVRILGLSDVPQAGDVFNAVEDDKLARQVADFRSEKKREEELRQTKRVTLDDLFNQIKEGEVKELNIVIKADVQGSVEAVRQSLERLTTSEVRVNVIHGGVGAISESDVVLASASNAIIIGFNVRPDITAKNTADREGVDIRLYRVIYDAISDVKAAMEGLLDPEFKENILGRAEVRATFKVPKVGVVAGCYIQSGKVTRNAQVRVLRDNIVIHEGKIDSLKRMKDDAREVVEGYECGIGIEKFNDVKEGDIFEAFVMEKVARQLE